MRKKTLIRQLQSMRIDRKTIDAILASNGSNQIKLRSVVYKIICHVYENYRDLYFKYDLDFYYKPIHESVINITNLVEGENIDLKGVV